MGRLGRVEGGALSGCDGENDELGTEVERVFLRRRLTQIMMNRLRGT